MSTVISSTPASAEVLPDVVDPGYACKIHLLAMDEELRRLVKQGATIADLGEAFAAGAEGIEKARSAYRFTYPAALDVVLASLSSAFVKLELLATLESKRGAHSSLPPAP